MRIFIKVLILFAMFCFTKNVRAQDVGSYSISTNVTYLENPTSHGACQGAYALIDALFPGGNVASAMNLYYKDLSDMGESEKRYVFESGNLDCTINRPFNKLVFSSERTHRNILRKCKSSGSGTSYLPLTYPYMNKKNLGLFPNWNSSVDVTVQPKEINLFYFDETGKYSSANIKNIPYDKKITIKATTGFPKEVYKWQYQVGANEFKDFPGGYNGDYMGKETIKFSVSDFPEPDRTSLLTALNNQTLRVRIDFNSKLNYRAPITLTPIMYAPAFKTLTPISPTCNGGENGGVKIKFDRALYPNERLEVGILIHGSKSDTCGKVTKETDTITIKGLKAGSHTFSLEGDYSIAGNKTYTIGNEYSASTTIKDFAKVTFADPTWKNIEKCNGDNTGEITVTPSGGRPPYTVFYKKENEPEKSQETVNGSAIIKNLYSGNYEIRVIDSNSCNGDNKRYTVNITQPESPLGITLIKSKSCTYHGANDGTATVEITGGSKSYPYITWTGVSGAKVYVSSSAGNKSTVTGTAGSYNLEVTDSYGCSKKLSNVEIKEPAQLTVSVAIIDMIKCTGDAGKIIAYGEGGVRPYTYKWYNTAAPTTAIANEVDSVLACKSGTYFVEIKDANEIFQKSNNLQNIESPLLLGVQKVRTTWCKKNDSTDGTATVEISGGTSPYIISWTDDSNGAIVTPTSADKCTITNKAGSYTVMATDAKGCIKSTQVSIEAPKVLSVSIAALSAIKCTGDDGKIIAYGEGGVRPYTYKWYNTNAPTTPIANAVDSVLTCKHGIYFVKITDANEIHSPLSNNIDLSESAIALSVDSVSSTSATGYAKSNGSAQMKIQGGTRNYVLSWINPLGQVIDIANILNDATNPNEYISTIQYQVAGKYTLNVTDAPGCVKSKTIIISQPDPLKITMNMDSIKCKGDFGTLSASVTGGVKPYSYKWFLDNGTGYKDVNCVDSILKCKYGVYKVVVVDKNLNSDSISKKLIDPELLTVSLQAEKIKCFGTSTGRIDATYKGGTKPYTYLWNTGDKTASLSDIKSGQYSVIVTDYHGCQAKDTVIVTESDSIKVTTYPTNVSCNGGNDGKVQFKVSGGTGTSYKLRYKSDLNANWKYSNTNFESDVTVLNLVKDIYYFVIEDAIGCNSREQKVPISQPSHIRIDSLSSVPAKGYGLDNGKAKVSITGGTPLAQGTYSLVWKNSVGTRIISNDTLSADGKTLYSTIENRAGKYKLVVADQNNCPDSLSITIYEPDSINVNIQMTAPIKCAKGSGTLVAHAKGGVKNTIQGSLPYNYKWYNNDSPDLIIKSPTDSTLNCTSGFYFVTITDANGNFKKSNLFEIKSPEELKVRIITTDVSVNSENNGAVEAIQGGGTGKYTYLWDTPKSDTTRIVHNLTAGTYKVTVTDENGCIATQTETVNKICETDSVNMIYGLGMELDPIKPSCIGDGDGKIKVVPSGGTGKYNLRYWLKDEPENIHQLSDFTSDIIISNLHAGDYSFILEAAGCTYSKSCEVINPTKVRIVNITEMAVSKHGLSNGSISAAIVGGNKILNKGYTLVWKDNEGKILQSSNTDSNDTVFSTVSNLKAGTYALVAEDAHFCADSVSKIITQPDSLIVSLVTQKKILIYGNYATIVANVSGGVAPYKYYWYKLSGRDSTLYSTEYHNSSLICPVGSYFVKIIDANLNELKSDVDILTQPDALDVSFLTSDVYCTGSNSGRIVATPSGGAPPYNYSWMTSKTNTTNTLNKLIKGDYAVIITDSLGTRINRNISIKQQPSMQVDVKLTDPTCDKGDDGKIEVLPSAGLPPYTIKWSDGQNQTLKTGLKAGVHEFTVTDNSGCWNTYTQTLINPAPVLVNLGSKVTLCQGQALTQNITLPNDAGAQYQWSDAAGTSHRTSDMLLSDPGTYTATITTSKGCIGSSSILVERSDKVLEADFMMASKAALGNSVEIINITYPLPNSASWIIPESSNVSVVENTESKLTLQFSELGEYTIGIKTKEGNCEKMLYKNIKIVDQSEMVDYKEGKEALIKKFIVSPNPTKGDFKVGVEFSEKIDAVLLLIDSDSGKTIERRELSNSDWYEAPFNVSMPAGNYMIHLVCTKAQANFKFLIKSGAY